MLGLEEDVSLFLFFLSLLLQEKTRNRQPRELTFFNGWTRLVCQRMMLFLLRVAVYVHRRASLMYTHGCDFPSRLLNRKTQRTVEASSAGKRIKGVLSKRREGTRSYTLPWLYWADRTPEKSLKRRRDRLTKWNSCKKKVVRERMD